MTPICFVDTETTSLRHDRRAWDVALIRRDDDGERTAQFYISLDDIDLPNADPFSLDIGRFWERHPDAASIREGAPHAGGLDEVYLGIRAARTVAHLTHGAHLVGAVPNFDAEVLANLIRGHGLIPAWHHHLIDVETLAVGYLAGLGNSIAPPWKSDDLAAYLNIETPEDERHTALGDARMAARIYDRIMGG